MSCNINKSTWNNQCEIETFKCVWMTFLSLCFKMPQVFIKTVFLHGFPSWGLCVAQRRCRRCRTCHSDCVRTSQLSVKQLSFLLLLKNDEAIKMDPGNKSDYRRVQIDRKPSCQPPPTLGKARNNSTCNEAALKRFPAALLQWADRLYSAWLCCWWWITEYSQWHQFCTVRLKGLTWSVNECEVCFKWEKGVVFEVSV